MAYGDFKGLPRKVALDKVLHYKAFNIAKNPKRYTYQHELASLVYKYLIVKSSGGAVKNEIIANQELAEELHKPIIRIMKNKNYANLFKDNIWGADLADMQLISKFIKGFRFLLFVIGIYSKYAWVVPVKANRGIIITNAVQILLDESNSRPNKIFVEKGSKFCNISMKSWLQYHDIEV